MKTYLFGLLLVGADNNDKISIKTILNSVSSKETISLYEKVVGNLNFEYNTML